MHYTPPPIPQFGLEQGPVLLRDGRSAFLRPARPEDRPLFVDLLSRLSPESRVFRFFSEVDPETAADLLLKGGPPERVVLVVLFGQPERIIATGEYALEDEDSAEVAFLVDEEFQGKGLGTLLLERLALLAVRQGIRRFHAYTLPDNQPMLEVFRASGFEVETRRGLGEIEIRFEIAPSPGMVAQFEFRDRVATLASLYPFFHPRGVAVVGASRDPQSVGYRVLEHLVLGRFAGPVYPVNPAVESDEVPVVGSILAYPSVEAIPGPVDLAVLTVPPDQVLKAAEACGARGVRALAVLTTGMTQGAIQELVQLVHRYGMRLLGPGSLGLVSTDPQVRLAAGLAPLPKPGPMALSSQSGTLGLAVLQAAQERGLGISSFVSLGAKADLSSNDFIQYWEDDPATGLIALYLESFGNPRRFARLARRIGHRKPILAVYPLQDPLVDALFAQAGVIRLEGLVPLFEVASILASQPLPLKEARHRVALVSNASGPSNLALGALLSQGLEVSHRDLGSMAPPELFRRAIREALADPSTESLMLLLVPLGPTSEEELSEVLAEELERAEAPKITLACFMSSLRAWTSWRGGRIPVFRFPEAAARALGRVVAYARWRAEPAGEFPSFGDPADWRGKTLEELLELLELKPSPEQPAEGLELEVRVLADPRFGPVLRLEAPSPLGPQLLGERLLPMSDREVLALLAPLDGRADLSALGELLLRVSQLASEIPQSEGLVLRLKVSPKECAIIEARR
jgi:succinyl-CoA synthetase alpha subunit/RimJ/RimL family protein N-acetyltransferase